MTPSKTFKQKLAHIIFDYDTVPAKMFDLVLIAAIILSVFVVMLDSVPGIHAVYGEFFYGLEWFFTILFTVEYGMRMYVASNRLRYATSFFGIIDLLSILPTYFSVFFSRHAIPSCYQVFQGAENFQAAQTCQVCQGR